MQATLKVVADPVQVRSPCNITDGCKAAFSHAEQRQHAHGLCDRSHSLQCSNSKLLPLSLSVGGALQWLQHCHSILKTAALHRGSKVHLQPVHAHDGLLPQKTGIPAEAATLMRPSLITVGIQDATLPCRPSLVNPA